jgi:hypothetical protein
MTFIRMTLKLLAWSKFHPTPNPLKKKEKRKNLFERSTLERSLTPHAPLAYQKITPLWSKRNLETRPGNMGISKLNDAIKLQK